MTQPKALNAEGKCVCCLREFEVCKEPYREENAWVNGEYCCNRLSDGDECAHDRACHPSPLNAEKEGK